jgi:hypothetical protein
MSKPASPRTSTTTARRCSSSGRALVLAILATGIFACTRSAGRTTTVTSGTYDVETGACMCRLPQDEFLSCCRSGMELTCRCNPNSSCFVVPTGRTCGKTPPARID